MKYLDGHPELDLLSRALSFSSPSLRVSTRIEAYSCKAIKSERKLIKNMEKDLVSDLTHSTSISPPEHYSSLVNSAFGPLDKRESRKTLWLLISTLNLAFPDHDFSRVNADEFTKEESARAVLSSLSTALSHLRASGSETSFYRSFSSYPPTSSSSLPGYPDGDGKDGRSRQGANGNKKVSRTNHPFSNLSGIALHNKLREMQNEGDGEIPTHPFLRTVLDPIISLGDCDVYSYTPDLDSDPHAYFSEDEEEYTTEEDVEMDDIDIKLQEPYYAGISAPSTPTSTSNSFRRYKRPRSTHLRHSSMKSIIGDHYEDMGGNEFMMDEDLESGDLTYESHANNDETGGLLWSSNYFFHNKKMKRVLFVSCWGRKLGHGTGGPDAVIAQQKMRLHRPFAPPTSTSSILQRAGALQPGLQQPSLFARLGLAIDGGLESSDSGQHKGVGNHVFNVGSAPAAFTFPATPSIQNPPNNPFRASSGAPATNPPSASRLRSGREVTKSPNVSREPRKPSTTPVQSPTLLGNPTQHNKESSFGGSGSSAIAPHSTDRTPIGTPRSTPSRTRGSKRRASSGGATTRSGRRRKSQRSTGP